LSRYQRKPRKTIPTSLPNLVSTPYMMENLVKEIYGIKPSQIKTISVLQINEGGLKGNLSDSGRLRVRLTTTEDNAVQEFYWFVKIQPHGGGPASNDNDNGFNIFNNEIEFYKKIVPEMQAFVTAEGLADQFTDLFDTPEMLYSNSDDESAIIVLKDIIADGYCHQRDNNGDKFLSVEQAVVAVRSLAKLHAVSVAMQNKRQMDLVTEYPLLGESGLLWTNAEMTNRLAIMKESYCQLLKQSQELDSPTLLNRFMKMFDSEERLIALCQKRCEYGNGGSEPRSLQHGDFHFNNLMFKTGDDGQMQVKIVDWQLTYAGRSTGDLSYLLLSSLSCENREQYENHIKDEYFSEYLQTLNKLENNSLAKQKLDNEYNDSLPLSFFLSCGNIMSQDDQDRCVQFSYDMCKEAAMKEII
jgi:aminoglycoside/choline kinase family phosphotransferase